MEKIKLLANLGFKYLKRYRRRYAFLLAALVFCFAIVTFITSSKDSMYSNLYYSAQSHYAGDIVAVGYKNSEHSIRYIGNEDIKSLLDAVDASGINPVHTVKRTNYEITGVVYFNGTPVVQKYVIGCDWEKEAHIFSKINFKSPVTGALTDDSIIISSPVADILGAKNGDVVTLEINNKFGQKDTGQFTVNGIIQDTSIFGYFKVYVSRITLNRLRDMDDNECTVMGFFLKNPSDAQESRLILHRELRKRTQTGPLLSDREDMSRELKTPFAWDDTKIFLYTLPVYLSEIASLMDAMNLLTYLLYGIMLIIILVSASVTYRLILHDRTKEIGVMRSIGFLSEDLKLVLWTEILILGFISIAAGFILSIIFSLAASFISFSWFPSFEIFLRNGRLTPLFLPKTVVLNIVLTLLILIIAVVFPASRASNKNLPSLLSGEPL
ncbi:MAG: FtsX-like permease family protein [Treponema sp.]|nr:FtsX-like permease family protein [Treponema sp.]